MGQNIQLGSAVIQIQRADKVVIIADAESVAFAHIHGSAEGQGRTLAEGHALYIGTSLTVDSAEGDDIIYHLLLVFIQIRIDLFAIIHDILLSAPGLRSGEPVAALSDFKGIRTDSFLNSFRTRPESASDFSPSPCRHSTHGQTEAADCRADPGCASYPRFPGCSPGQSHASS